MAQANAFQDIDALHREIDRAFENLVPFTGPFARMAFLPGRLARGYPLVNVHEDKDRLYVEAMAAGIDPGSLNISVVHNTLTISGEKKGAPEEIKPQAFHREERGSTRKRSRPSSSMAFLSSIHRWLRAPSPERSSSK